MSVSPSRRLRAAIAAAALITTATATAVAVGTSAANAEPVSSVPNPLQQPGDLLVSLNLRTLSTGGWTGTNNPAAVDPATSPEGVPAEPSPAPAPPPAPLPAPEPAPLAVTPDALARIVPGIQPEKIAQYIAPLNDAMTNSGIDTPVRQAAFIAQLAVESDSFRTFEEYASGSAYEGRADLGNTQPGDGERYKGRGAIQITGRHNYEKLSEHTGVDFVANPEWLSAPENAFVTAAWYWTSRNLNQVADTSGIVRVSELVNGGHNALSRRIDDFQRGLDVLIHP